MLLHKRAEIGTILGRSDEKLQEERRTLSTLAVVRTSGDRENYGGQAPGENKRIIVNTPSDTTRKVTVVWDL